MLRLATALAAILALAPVARAQDDKPADKTAPSSAPTLAPAAPPAKAGDDAPATKAEVKAQIDKAKQEIADEVHAQVQGAQTAREWGETFQEEKPKLDLLQLDGYLRTRGDLLDNLDLHREADPSGWFLFPRSVVGGGSHGTLTTANMRFRLDPTLNVSEEIKVRATVDMLDDLVLGSSALYQNVNDRYPLVMPGRGLQTAPASATSAIDVKRAWAEVKTPIGQLRFGRMPSEFGMGIVANAGNKVDDDYGDTADRILFATRIPTPLGGITVVPMLDFLGDGPISTDTQRGPGLGQPFIRDQAGDARDYSVIAARMDSEDELKKKLDKGAVVNYGAWYHFRTQTFDFLNATSTNGCGATDQGMNTNCPPLGYVKRDAQVQMLDLWGRYDSKRLHLEGELVGVYGGVGNISSDPANPLGPVLVRQFGGAVQGEYKLSEGRLGLGGEAGVASGDSNPGFGNHPERGAAIAGDIDGQQVRPGDSVLDIRNFRFNPAHRIDLLLWREILGNVTDAFYAKPTLRYEMLPGLVGTAAIVYSQALYAESTPSWNDTSKSGHTPLGVEGDLGLTYLSDDGFEAWMNFGALQPLDGLGNSASGGPALVRGYAFRGGFAVKF